MASSTFVFDDGAEKEKKKFPALESIQPKDESFACRFEGTVLRLVTAVKTHALEII